MSCPNASQNADLINIRLTWQSLFMTMVSRLSKSDLTGVSSTIAGRSVNSHTNSPSTSESLTGEGHCPVSRTVLRRSKSHHMGSSH